jgi:hypothetical protein
MVQSPALAIAHPPAVQHAPEQAVVQDEPSPCHVPPAMVQSPWICCEHPPAVQQAPVGCGQLAAAHVTPVPP